MTDKAKRISETTMSLRGLDAMIPTERELEAWMGDALRELDISDVQVSYVPDASKIPLEWFEDLGILIIHEVDPFEAALTFLRWVPRELLSHLNRVIDNVADIQRIRGNREAVAVFRDYRRRMEALTA